MSHVWIGTDRFASIEPFTSSIVLPHTGYIVRPLKWRPMVTDIGCPPSAPQHPAQVDVLDSIEDKVDARMFQIGTS